MKENTLRLYTHLAPLGQLHSDVAKTKGKTTVASYSVLKAYLHRVFAFALPTDTIDGWKRFLH